MSVALCRVAPSVRFSAFAIFESEDLRAMPLRTRMSALDQMRLTVAFLRRTAAFAIVTPMEIYEVRRLLCTIRGEYATFLRCKRYCTTPF